MAVTAFEMTVRSMAVLALVAAASACSTLPKGSNGPNGSPKSTSRVGLATGEVSIQIPVQKRELSNGLTVLLVEDHTVPVVSYQSWYRVGSVDEHPGKTGISHLFEHLMFKGTPKYGPKQFFLQLEAKGAEVNAFTTRDYTVYHETFVPEMLEKVVDMESDRMANLILDQATLDSERIVVLEERKLRTENVPEGKMQEALWSLAYRRHPYRWPVIGYPPDLFSITVEDLQSWFRSHYQPANLVVVVVGDVQAEATFEMIRKAYEKIPAQRRPKRDPLEEPEQNEERRLALYDHVASERLMQAFHISAADQEDSYALDVLSNILFEGTSSRAYRKLVEDQDIALGVSGSSFTPTYPGIFIMTATMKAGVPAEKAEQSIAELIREAQDKEVSADEIVTAVKQLTVQLVDSVRTPHGLGQLIGTVQTVLGSPDRIAEDLEKYLRVTADDVKRVARKYLVPNNRSVVTLLPSRSASRSP